MSQNLFKKIRLIRNAAHRIKPDVDWIAVTRATLAMQVRNSLPVGAVEKRSVFKEWMKFFAPFLSFGKWLRTPVLSATAVLLALFGGSLLSVSAAEKSLPGDLLYSVKLATEQARIAMAKNSQERLILKTEFTGRRVDEMKQVVADPTQDRKDKVMQTAEVLKRDMHTLKQQLGEMQDQSTPQTVRETAKIVDEKTNAMVQALQDSKQSMTPEEKAKVTEAQAAASDASVKAIEVLADTHKTDGDVVTEQDMADVLKTHNETVVRTMAQTMGINPDTVTSTIALAVPATSTSMTSSTMVTLQQVNEAQKSLTEADKLVTEKKIDEAVEKVKLGTQQAFAAQKTADQANVALANGQTVPFDQAGNNSGSVTSTASDNVAGNASTTSIQTTKSTTTVKTSSGLPINSTNTTSTKPKL